MRRALTVVVACAVAVAAWAGEPGSFGDEPLVTPTTINRTTDRCQPRVLRVDGVAKTIRLEFARGAGGGGAFTEHARDNRTLRNEVDPETGEPDPARQDWTTFIGGTQIADWCRAQPAAPTNGAVLRKLFFFLLTSKGVTP